MKIIAIISEYNPFHMGHLYQINKIKHTFKNDDFAIISIMSGNFVQRGEPSIIDKFKRCEVALHNGINLCFEIPVHISLSSAEGFAFGTIKILNKLGIVDYLCFGCEDPDITALEKISNKLISLEATDYKKYSRSGLSFPKIRELIISDFFKDNSISNLMKFPNNILAIEYLKSIKLLNSSIKVLPIRRIGSTYNDMNLSNKFSSATSIRKVLYNYKNDISILKNHLPELMYNHLKREFFKKNIINSESMFNYVKYKLMTNKNLYKINDVSEGLENRFYSKILKSNTLEELILNVKSKRYTYSRLSRILTRYFIGFDIFEQNEVKEIDDYIRVLGFDEKGSKILNKLRKVSGIPIFSKFNKKNSYLVKLDTLASNAYSTINKNFCPLSDFKTNPIIKL